MGLGLPIQLQLSNRNADNELRKVTFCKGNIANNDNDNNNNNNNNNNNSLFTYLTIFVR